MFRTFLFVWLRVMGEKIFWLEPEILNSTSFFYPFELDTFALAGAGDE